MILLGWALDKPLALLFDPFESIVLYVSGMFPYIVMKDEQKLISLGS